MHAEIIDRANHLAQPGTASTAHPVPSRGDVAAALHLDEAFQAAQCGASARLASLLEPLVRATTWTQTEAYVIDPPHTQVLNHYAHTALLGAPGTSPLAIDRTDTVTLGLLLLGPGNLYPHHHHAADEVYLPVTHARWSDGAGQRLHWAPAGVPMQHTPWQPHAAQAAETHPLLAIYLWTGDRTTSAHFIRQGCRAND